MTEKEQKVTRGNISTYEGASDEFLRKRKEDLRSQIRNPNLTANEFVREVITRAFVTTVAAAWSVWNGLTRLVEINPKFASKYLKAGSNVYVADTGAFERGVEGVARVMASVVFHGKKPQHGSAIEIYKKIMEMARELGLNTGVPALEELYKNVLTKSSISEAQKCKALYATLEDVLKQSATSGIGQFATIWKEMTNLFQGAFRHSSSEGLLHDALSRTREQVLHKAVIEDNIHILNRYRIPATVIATAGATLLTGYQAYRFAKRQKSLDQESEMSHIERLEQERADAKAAAASPQAAR